MNLRIHIAHKERACFDVHPAGIPNALLAIDSQIAALELQGKVAVMLDSDVHPNLVYLLYPRRAHNGKS